MPNDMLILLSPGGWPPPRPILENPSGGSKAIGSDACHLGSNSFIFMQILAKYFWEIID